tara:strand:- start:511 stop:630 length:120 start_codon:yes stop_codon:yes gene_type:complete
MMTGLFGVIQKWENISAGDYLISMELSQTWDTYLQEIRE